LAQPDLRSAMGNSPSADLGGGSAHSSRDVRTTINPETEVKRSSASRAPTHNEYNELPASSKPHTDHTVTQSGRLLAVIGIMMSSVCACGSVRPSVCLSVTLCNCGSQGRCRREKLHRRCALASNFLFIFFRDFCCMIRVVQPQNTPKNEPTICRVELVCRFCVLACGVS